MFQVALLVGEPIANMHKMNYAYYEAVGADFDGGVFGAFKRDGGLGDTGDGNFLGRQGGKWEIV